MQRLVEADRLLGRILSQDNTGDEVMHSLGIHPSFRGKYNSQQEGVNGNMTAYRLKANEILQTGDVSGKDNFFLDVARLGLELREGRRIDQGTPGYRFLGYSEEIAKNYSDRSGTEITKDQLHRLVLAARADLVIESRIKDPLSDKPVLPQFVLAEFQKAVDDYIADYSQRTPKDVPGFVRDLKNQWELGNIKEFYRLLSRHGKWTAGSFFPYELRYLGVYFADRVRNQRGTTSFDRLVLDEGITRGDDYELAQRIADGTGLRTRSDSFIKQYRHLLIFGEPNSTSETKVA